MVVVEVGDSQYLLSQLLFERAQIWLLPLSRPSNLGNFSEPQFFMYTVEQSFVCLIFVAGLKERM